MEAKGADASLITWIPIRVSLDRIPYSEPEVGKDTFTLLYACGHGLANELDDILNAAAILKQTEWSHRVRFRLVGDGPEKARLVQRVELERLDSVSFKDSVPKREVYRMLQQADAFLVVVRAPSPYKYGVSLNRFFDYMAMAVRP